MDERGTPVGRRVFFGLVGLGAAGILLGARAQDWLERVVGPLIAKDGTGLASLLPIGRFRIYTVTGDLPSRSRARFTAATTSTGLAHRAMSSGRRSIMPLKTLRASS